jgi:hypothetical protein
MVTLLTGEWCGGSWAEDEHCVGVADLSGSMGWVWVCARVALWLTDRLLDERRLQKRARSPFS